MSLPTIEAYSLPTVDDLPPARVAWQVDPSRAVLLVHDMQQHFVAPFDADAGPLGTVVANLAGLIGDAREAGIPVVYSAQPAAQTPRQRGLLQDFWGSGIVDARAAAVIPELAPAETDIVLTKWRYSAFQRTDLAAILAERGRDQLVIGGIYAHIGVQATACEAFMQDVQAFVVADAVADFSGEHHTQALRFVADRCARVLTTAQTREAFCADPVPVAAAPVLPG